MTNSVEPFHVDHAREIAVTAEPRPGFTLRIDGAVAVCGGAIPTPDGGYHLWAVIAPRAPMLAVTRATRRFLETLSPRAFVATTPCDFAAGRRWLELLGFIQDDLIPQYADGVDHAVYRRRDP